MKIDSIEIKNYKSILDSGDIHIEDKITIFVGKNESGKSNILEAIRDINGFEDSERLFPYQDDRYKPEIKIEGLLTEKENQQINGKYGFEINEPLDITISFDEGKHVIFSEEVARSLMEICMADFQKETGYFVSLFSGESEIEFIKENYGENAADKYQEACKNFDVKANELEKDIISFIPKIKYLSVFQNNLPERIDENNINDESVKMLADFVMKQSEGRIKNNIFSEIINTPQAGSQRKNTQCDKVSKVLTNFFEKNYTQYNLKFDLATGDKYIDIFVRDVFSSDTEPGLGQYLDQRSTGLNWFVSFVLTCNSFNENEIFVIDEPGMYLHFDGQQNMLKILDDISKERQIIFCTHSPYLIDIDKLPYIRLVERQEAKLDGISFKETVVHKNLHSYKDEDTVKVLCDAIGYNITNGLTYHSKKALLVEGVSDLLLLKAFAKIIKKDLDYDVFYASSSSKMEILHSLVLGLGARKIVILFDADKAGYEEYKSKEQFKDISIFTHEIGSETVTTKKRLTLERSIEDILSKDDFNKYYLKQGDEQDDGSKTNSQIAKKVGSKYLKSKLMFDNIESCEFSDETKENIEKLFKRIDEILSLASFLMKQKKTLKNFSKE